MDDEIEVVTPDDGNVVDDKDLTEGDESGEMLDGDTNPEGSGDEDDGDVIVIAGEEPDPDDEDDLKGPAPKWVKETREVNKELRKEVRELKKKLESAPTAPSKEDDIGKEPDIEDFDYDKAKYQEALKGWLAKQATTEQRKKDAEAAQAKANEAWQSKLNAVAKAESTVKFKGYAEAKSVVEDSLSEVQYAMLHDGFSDPATVAKVKFALGSNPKKLKELAAITNPVQFAVAIGQLESKLTVTPRRTAPLPDKQIRGSAASVSGSDATLARLEKQADQTGDRSKVISYKREQRQKLAAKTK